MDPINKSFFNPAFMNSYLFAIWSTELFSKEAYV